MEFSFNCEFSNALTGGNVDVPAGNNNDFEFSILDCNGFATSTATSSDTSQPVEVFFSSSTIASSSDVFITNHITAGDALVSFLILFLAFTYIFVNLSKALFNVKKDKIYLQYGGGDVQMRKDL